MPSSRSVDHAVANNSISSGRVVPKGNNPSYLVLHSLDEVPPFELYVDQLPIVIQTKVPAYLSMKCCARSTTDGPTMVKELSCHGIRAKSGLSFPILLH
jgi:hypothetical protein